MTILPLKLNFFKETEMFFTLNALDGQYDSMIKKYNLTKEVNNPLTKEARGEHFNINWPTWNIEKKILRWTFLNHKHLGSSITIEKLKSKDFLIDINPEDEVLKENWIKRNQEVTAAGGQYIIKNLIARGFANISPIEHGCVTNQAGLEVGSLIYRIYKFKIADMGEKNTDYYNLVSKNSKKIGYELFYISAILLWIWGIFLGVVEIIKRLNLLDNSKFLISSFFPSLEFLVLQDFLTILFFVPLPLFLAALILTHLDF